MDQEFEKSINGSEDELDIETGMYMLCSGEVIILKNEKQYQKFLENENLQAESSKLKSQINDSYQYGGIAKIGWVITTYMLNTPKLKEIIENKI